MFSRFREHELLYAGGTTEMLLRPSEVEALVEHQEAEGDPVHCHAIVASGAVLALGPRAADVAERLWPDETQRLSTACLLQSGGYDAWVVPNAVSYCHDLRDDEDNLGTRIVLRSGNSCFVRRALHHVEAELRRVLYAVN